VDKTIEKIEHLNIALIGVGSLLAWASGLMHVPSFLLGGALMHVNFWLLKKVVRTTLSPAEGRMGKKTRAALWFSAKGVLFLLFLSALFIRYPIQAGSFTVGASLLLLACVIVSLPGLRTNPGEEIYTGE